MSCKLTVSSPPRDAFDLGRLFIDIWVGYNNKTSDFIFLLCLLDRRKSVQAHNLKKCWFFPNAT
jgi:hypothetical protein